MSDTGLQPALLGRAGEVTTLKWVVLDDPRPVKILWLFGGLGIGKTSVLMNLRRDLESHVSWVEYEPSARGLPSDLALYKAYWHCGTALVFVCEDCDELSETVEALLSAMERRAEILGEGMHPPASVLLVTSRRQPPAISSLPNLLVLKMPVGPLREDDTLAMLRTRIGSSLHPLTEARLLELTAGYPAFINIVADAIRPAIGLSEQSASPELVDRVMFDALRHPFFRRLWHSLNVMEKSVLVTVATWADRRGGWATLSDIQTELQNHVGHLVARTIFPRVLISDPDDVQRQVQWMQTGRERLNALKETLARLNGKIQAIQRGGGLGNRSIDAHAARDLLRAERRLQELLDAVPAFGQRVLERLDKVPAQEVYNAFARFQPERYLLEILQMIQSPLVAQALRRSPAYSQIREEEQALFHQLDAWNPVRGEGLDIVLHDLSAQSLIICSDGKYRILPQLLHRWLLDNLSELAEALWR